MAVTQRLTARVSPETKRRVGVVAARQLITTSIWLRRVIGEALGQEFAGARTVSLEQSIEFYRQRLSVRIRPADASLLKTQALARGMKASTYVSVLIRSHLRSLSPLPKRELLALRQAVSELGAIARNLGCMVSAGDTAVGQQDLRTTQRICEELRNDIKALIKTNAGGWGLGNATDHDGTIQGEKITAAIPSRHQYPNPEPSIRNSEH